MPADEQVRELADRLNAVRTVALFCGALSIPPHVTVAQMRGFALAATRVVLSGGSAEWWRCHGPACATPGARPWPAEARRRPETLREQADVDVGLIQSRARANPDGLSPS
jgi:hypothetical protein